MSVLRETPDLSSEPILELRPLDAYNRELARHVRPPGWVNPEPAPRYNLVVIGAGTAGLVAAAGAAGLGAKVALVERRLMGGDCLNVGCVPSKALLRCARAVADARRAGEFGVRIPGGIRTDFAAVMERMRRLRAGIAPHDSAGRFRDLGVDVFFGDARFTGPDQVEVGGKSLRFRRALVATGGRASAPRIPGLQEGRYLTHETVFSLESLPARLVVIGAGPIGCELAQAFARFGSEVTLIETLHGVLPREDREAAAVVEGALRRDGVRVLCCGRRVHVSDAAGATRIHVESHDGAHDLDVDAILVAAGRKPNVENLGLEEAGVAFDENGIQVDARLRTTNPRVWAAGDVASRYKFTHAADALARVVVQNALFYGRAKADSLVIPWCTYTDPEVAHVGLTAEQAESEGIDLDTYRVPFRDVDRAVLDGDADEGLLKIHARKGTDRIVGATVVAPHAGDIVAEIVHAMTTGTGLEGIARTIHPYPTQAEAVKKAGDAYLRTRLTPRLARLFSAWFRWTRRG